MGDVPHQVMPVLHLRAPEEHVLFELTVGWPPDLTLVELESRLMTLGCLPLPGDRVDHLILRIGVGNGVWRFSARRDWRSRPTD